MPQGAASGQTRNFRGAGSGALRFAFVPRAAWSMRSSDPPSNQPGAERPSRRGWMSPDFTRIRLVTRLMLALMASASVALAACSGTSPRRQAQPPPGALSSIARLALPRTRLGTWMTIAQNQNSPAKTRTSRTAEAPASLHHRCTGGGPSTRRGPEVVLQSPGDVQRHVTARSGTLSTLTSVPPAISTLNRATVTRGRRCLIRQAQNWPARTASGFTAIYTSASGNHVYKTAVDYIIDGAIVTLTAAAVTRPRRAPPHPDRRSNERRPASRGRRRPAPSRPSDRAAPTQKQRTSSCRPQIEAWPAAIVRRSAGPARSRAVNRGR